MSHFPSLKDYSDVVKRYQGRPTHSEDTVGSTSIVITVHPTGTRASTVSDDTKGADVFQGKSVINVLE